ncbi:hypothetical protein HW556_09345 [Hymenobacter sp. P5252]|uniref:Uncharacterized protein n=1 Tax=Hymenobacter terrestris TaxID=2748310 RepID=A0ABX2Q299_9BACT|nr:hypothetical protein [Hymenobacter terrestris]NVO85085.1 hypothetical protein [Hymenobacter terrestris]
MRNNSTNGQRQRQLPGLIEQAHEIQAFDVPLLAVVSMVINQLVGIGMRLFQHRTV